MNDPHLKRLAFIIRHTRGMMDNMGRELDAIEAAYRDEDETSLGDALDQLSLLVFEVANDARNILMTARRANDLEADGSDPARDYRLDQLAG